MLKKIVDSITGESNEQEFDPSIFNDPVALSTEWTPFKKGGASFKTHQLRKVHDQRVEFRSTRAMMLFAIMFLAFGIGTAVLFFFLFSNRDESDDIKTFVILPILAIAFSGGGFWMLRCALIPAVFDLTHGYYCKSRQKPEHMMDTSQLEEYVELDRIHALQILSEYVSSKNSAYHSYELNLVLDDGSRLNVTDHGDRRALQQDANTLSELLGKPVWNTRLPDVAISTRITGGLG